MDIAFGRLAAMRWPSPYLTWRRMAPGMPDFSKIDWKETGALLGVLISAGIILRALLKPLLEHLFYASMKERFERYDKAVETAHELVDKVEAIEAMVMAQATAIRELPQLSSMISSLRDAVNRFDATMQSIDGHVQGLQRFQSRVEGIWEGQMRREGSPTMPGGRRKDDPPPRKRE